MIPSALNIHPQIEWPSLVSNHRFVGFHEELCSVTVTEQKLPCVMD